MKIIMIILLSTLLLFYSKILRNRFDKYIPSPPLFRTDPSPFPQDMNFIQIPNTINNTFESLYNNIDINKVEELSRNSLIQNTIKSEENLFSNYFNNLNENELKNVSNTYYPNIKNMKITSKDNDLLLLNMPTFDYKNIYKNLLLNNTNLAKDMPIIDLPTDPSKIGEELNGFYSNFNVDLLNQNITHPAFSTEKHFKGKNKFSKNYYRFQSKNSGTIQKENKLTLSRLNEMRIKRKYKLKTEFKLCKENCVDSCKKAILLKIVKSSEICTMKCYLECNNKTIDILLA